MTFKRILIATDFSDLAARGVQCGIDLARATKASVLLLHVIENTWYPGTFGMGAMPLPDLESEVRKAAKERLDKLATELGTSEVNCRVQLRDGVPWSEIVNAAKEEKVDLIVLSTHGYTGIKHALLGSQAERVVRTATCPVLTVPDEKA
ncbi:MAG: universal stress protein [Planctomycetota bacterium]